MAIKVKNTTVIDDNRNLVSVAGIDTTTKSALTGSGMVDTTEAQTLTNKTFTSPIINGAVTGDIVLSVNDWEAGTDTTESLVSPAKIAAAIATQAADPIMLFEDETIAPAGTITASHFLGRLPICQPFIKCITAEGGYSVGDILLVNAGENAISDSAYGHSITVTITDVTVKFAVFGRYQIVNKTNGYALATSVDKWTFGMYIR